MQKSTIAKIDCDSVVIVALLSYCHSCNELRSSCRNEKKSYVKIYHGGCTF